MKIIKIEGYTNLKLITGKIMDEITKISNVSELPNFELNLSLEENIKFLEDVNKDGKQLFIPAIDENDKIEIKRINDSTNQFETKFLGPFGTKFKVISGVRN